MRITKVKIIVITLILQVVSVLLGVAFYTLTERKVLGYIQNRKGPNKPGLLGLLVPFADAIKLISKENNTPSRRNKVIYLCVPLLSLAIPFLLFVTYPSKWEVLNLHYSILLIVCVSAVGVYAVLGAGWRSNRKYRMIGALRSVAQSVSYEVSLTLIVIHWIAFFYFSLMLSKLSVLITFLFLLMFLFLVTTLAETNRSPFDFAEGESELVSGFNTEYSSVPFVMIFLAEYMRIIFMSMVVRQLFNISDYWDMYFFVLTWSIVFIWRRGTLPRLRYDQLMHLVWKSYLPSVLCSASLVIII